MSTTQHKAAKAANAEVKKEVHENQMHDPDQPIGTRVKAAAKVPGDKMQAEAHQPSYTSAGVPVGPGHVHPAATAVPVVGGHPATGVHHGVYNPPGVIEHPTVAPGVGGHPTTGVVHPTTGVVAPTSGIYPTTGAVHPTTGVVHPTTGVVHPTTGAVHPTTGVVHPTTGVVHPTTGVVHPGVVDANAYAVNPDPNNTFTAGHHDQIHNPKAANAEAKKELHYAQAKDQNETTGTRVKAAVKVPADKVKEAALSVGSGDKKAKHHPVTTGVHPTTGAVHPTTGVVHPTTGVVHPTTGVVHPTTGVVATGVHGDPTQYSVHPHSTVVPATGVVPGEATYPVAGGKVRDPLKPKKVKTADKVSAKKEILKAETKLDHNDHPAGSTTYAGHSTAPKTKHHDGTKHTAHGVHHSEEAVKLQEAELKKEVHKQEAADSNNSMGERIKAAVKVPVDAVQVKVAEHKAEKEAK